MISNLRITLTITNLRVFFKSSLIAKIMLSSKLKIAQLLRPKSSNMGLRACFFKM